MSGIEEIPTQSRLIAYDYGNSTWRSVNIQSSGIVKTADGERLITAGVVRSTQASGGQELASGVVKRVLLSVPICVDGSGIRYNDSGLGIAGIWVGGSGTALAPYSASGGFSGGYGLWVQAGNQKELYVDNVNKIHVCGEPSGWPVTFVGEQIP